ncbi:GntR family transcriptional regulator [Leucobacter sp. wl10]|uniref:GntR family transcriptional regulator n=1 Tax=Leucobacter sp. wl10 TaxID=2304677 RepID=UPI000E5AB283|nr:GntR family transcriptional regulator [Leucobacter sp. wl10]RGE17620.1 GntR family transcriptional regulator [Leucobacter sp. wl10]
MNIEARIDPRDPRPPFEQLRTQLIERIMSREIPAGTKLPAVRRLAAELALAPNTVARAYRELEADGYLITRGRNGTVVAPVAAVDAETQRRAADLVAAYVSGMRGLGIGPDTILGEVRRALE